MNDILNCAKDAHHKICKVKDPSIQAFLRSFGVEGKDKENSYDVYKWLATAEKKEYGLLKTSILDFNSMNEFGNLRGRERFALKGIRRDFENHF